MGGYIDLHCHWVIGIDDGVKTVADSAALISGLRSIGFETVVATPHMRPGMFDNTSGALRAAYAATCAALQDVQDVQDVQGVQGVLDVQRVQRARGLPRVMLSSEHFFDDIVFQRLLRGEGLPYPGGHAVLVELPTARFPAMLEDRFFDLRRRHLRPVLAHPERYEPVWKDPRVLEPLLDGGAVLLLDVAALEGKYGRAPQRAAERLLVDGYYYAACSDAHAPRDVPHVERGIARLYELIGEEDAAFMLEEGPRNILEGRVET
jgi:protein-tyrosine phosphatase